MISYSKNIYATSEKLKQLIIDAQVRNKLDNPEILTILDQMTAGLINKFQYHIELEEVKGLVWQQVFTKIATINVNNNIFSYLTCITHTMILQQLRLKNRYNNGIERVCLRQGYDVKDMMHIDNFD